MNEATNKYPIPTRASWGKWLDKFSGMKPGESLLLDGPSARGVQVAARRLKGKGAVRQKKISENVFRVWRVK